MSNEKKIAIIIFYVLLCLFSSSMAHAAVFVTDNPAQKNNDGIGVNNRLWPNGIIPYRIDSSVKDKDTLEALRRAIKDIHRDTVIQFELFKEDDGTYPEFVTFVWDEDVCSVIFSGWRPNTKNTVQLLGCGARQGSIAHELGHVIGLIHEHQRSDREKWINLIERNLDKDKWGQERIEANYYSYSPQETINIGTYQLSSGMHYSPYSIFGTDITTPLFKPVPGASFDIDTIGSSYNEIALSRQDRKAINLVYSPTLTPTLIPGLIPGLIPKLNPKLIPKLTPKLIPSLAYKPFRKNNSTFPIVSSGGRCLSVDAVHFRDRYTDGKVSMWDCDQYPYQQWFMDVNRTVSRIESTIWDANGQCLTVKRTDWDSRNNGVRVFSAPCIGQAHQRWIYDKVANTLKSRNGLCLDVDVSGLFSQNARIQLWHCAGSKNQRFYFGRDFKRLVSEETSSKFPTHGSCLAVKPRVNPNEHNDEVATSLCTSLTPFAYIIGKYQTQGWVLTQEGYMLNYQGGCLDIDYTDYQNNARRGHVTLQNCTGDGNQRWRLKNNHQLVNIENKSCLDIYRRRLNGDPLPYIGDVRVMRVMKYSKYCKNRSRKDKKWHFDEFPDLKQ